MFVNREPLCGVLSRVCVFSHTHTTAHDEVDLCSRWRIFICKSCTEQQQKKTRSKRNRLTEMTLRFDKSMRYSSFPTEAEKKRRERETIHKLKHLPLLLLFAFIMWYNADTFYHFDGFFNAY